MLEHLNEAVEHLVGKVRHAFRGIFRFGDVELTEVDQALGNVLELVGAGARFGIADPPFDELGDLGHEGDQQENIGEIEG